MTDCSVGTVNVDKKGALMVREDTPSADFPWYVQDTGPRMSLILEEKKREKRRWITAHRYQKPAFSPELPARTPSLDHRGLKPVISLAVIGMVHARRGPDFHMVAFVSILPVRGASPCQGGRKSDSSQWFIARLLLSTIR